MAEAKVETRVIRVETLDTKCHEIPSIFDVFSEREAYDLMILDVRSIEFDS